MISYFLTLYHSCPGAVLFLFEVKFQGKVARYLHTGDFRAHPSHINHPAISSLNVPFDVVFYDTTYCKPSHKFPSQENVLSVIKDMAVRSKTESIQSIIANKNPCSGLFNWLSSATTNILSTTKKTIFFVGSYTIGKERVFIEIAKALDTKIYVETSKRRILKCIRDEEIDNLLCSDKQEVFKKL